MREYTAHTSDALCRPWGSSEFHKAPGPLMALEEPHKTSFVSPDSQILQNQQWPLRFKQQPGCNHRKNKTQHFKLLMEAPKTAKTGTPKTAAYLKAVNLTFGQPMPSSPQTLASEIKFLLLLIVSPEHVPFSELSAVLDYFTESTLKFQFYLLFFEHFLKSINIIKA